MAGTGREEKEAGTTRVREDSISVAYTAARHASGCLCTGNVSESNEGVEEITAFRSKTVASDSKSGVR